MIKNSDISVIVPVYNEEESVKEIYLSLKDLKIGEIIFVDDGSTDATRSVIKKLTGVRLLYSNTNRGLSYALQRGFNAATKDYIVTVDGDLQFNLNEIDKLKTEISKGYDVVCGWRYSRADTMYKRFISRMANKFRIIVTRHNIHDSGCTFRIYNKVASESLNLKYGYHRFIPLILERNGFSVAEIKVSHKPRRFGYSKFTNFRIIEGVFTLFRILIFE